MEWNVELYPLFAEEFEAFPETVKDRLLEEIELLEAFGPLLGRPTVDTLSNSKHSNMKELRFDAGDGTWRTAFAFDPQRRAILLVAGDKSGSSQKRFYKRLIKKADDRFDEHLKRLKKQGND
ncbi:MAG: type II toxin-antitoxin system RelE/ParE family toxin [Cyanobacteria bacterium J06621_3]